MMLTRRSFLKLLAAVAASGVSIPAMSERRMPYVQAGEVVSYIGTHPGGFIGGQLVEAVEPWDGTGLPSPTLE